MSETRNDPTLDDVIDPVEQANPDHKAHAKTPKHLNEDNLDARTERERREVDTDPSGA